MKRAKLLISLLLIMASLYGQQSMTQSQIRDRYLQKSKSQNTAGWILLGVGTPVMIGGLLAFGKSWDDASATTTDIWGFVTLAGFIADVASIPVFICAGRNKRKAASITLGYQNSFLNQEGIYCLKPQPVLKLTINF